MGDRQYDGTDNAFVYDGEPTPSLPEDVARVVERLEYERDVWHSKSTMHQKDATAARAERDRLAAELADARSLMSLAHAVMRECGWQLAPGHDPQGDGVLELAVAEIEEKFRTALAGKAGEA